MTWLDYAVGGVFALSVLVSIWRGLVKEVISVLGWVIAFLAANLLAGPLGLGLFLIRRQFALPPGSSFLGEG